MEGLLVERGPKGCPPTALGQGMLPALRAMQRGAESAEQLRVSARRSLEGRVPCGEAVARIIARAAPASSRAGRGSSSRSSAAPCRVGPPIEPLTFVVCLVSHVRSRRVPRVRYVAEALREVFSVEHDPEAAA